MGWETPFWFPHPKWSSSPLSWSLLDMKLSLWVVQDPAGSSQITAGLAIPVHPTACGECAHPVLDGAVNHFYPGYNWIINIMGSSLSDRTATLEVRSRPYMRLSSIMGPFLIPAISWKELLADLAAPSLSREPRTALTINSRIWLLLTMEISSHMLYDPSRTCTVH